jgi:hypothetical protein
MKDGATVFAAVAGFLSLLAIVIWWRITVWQECRTDHSWMYCISMMSGK